MKIKFALTACLAALTLVSCTQPRPQNTRLWQEDIKNDYVESYSEPTTILALSGGGPNGAWGAGLLSGWKNKPKFKIVTGISTGSILAVYAFLDDPKYNEIVRDTYRGLRTIDIIDLKPATMIAFNTAISSNERLKALIASNMSDSLIDEVASQGKLGRKLIVGTTDLDYGEFVEWDLTQIAAARQYGKFRDVVLASCSIPMVYEPVFIDGSMNVDGGVSKIVFVPKILPKDTKKEIYVIYNGAISKIGKTQTQNSLIGIAKRSLAVISDSNNHAALNDILETDNSIVYYSQVDVDTKLLGMNFSQKDVQTMYDNAEQTGRDGGFVRLR